MCLVFKIFRQLRFNVQSRLCVVAFNSLVFGFILFRRNCDTPAQVAALTRDLRASVNRPNAPVLIDQEGGRVARLRPPHWRKAPAPAVFGRWM